MMGRRTPRTSASAYQSPSRRAGVGSSREGGRHECCAPCRLRSIRCRRDRRRGSGRDAGFQHHAHDSTSDEPALEGTAACTMRFAQAAPRRPARRSVAARIAPASPPPASHLPACRRDGVSQQGASRSEPARASPQGRRIRIGTAALRRQPVATLPRKAAATGALLARVTIASRVPRSLPTKLAIALSGSSPCSTSQL